MWIFRALVGALLWEADVAIKTNVMDPEPALAAWLGEHLLGTRRAG